MPAPPRETAPPPGSHPVTSGRDAALDALAALAARFPDIQPPEIDDTDLDPREAALAHALADAVVRRWITLAYLIETAGGRPIAAVEPHVRAALLGGLAQMVFLDRIPAHAAIHATVEWTKRRGRIGAAGLVNAVLRRAGDLVGDRPLLPAWTGRPDEIPLADGAALRLAAPCLPHDRDAAARVALSIPRALHEAWRRSAGPEAAASRMLHTLVTPPLILNTRFANPASIDPALVPHHRVGHHVAPRGMLPSHALTLAPGAWVQDPTAASSLDLAAELRPARVLDLCAGRGTKTRQLLAMFPNAHVVAAEVEGARFADLRRLLRGEPRAEARELASLGPGDAPFDLILLDVPCSNTGVLARRPEARYRWGPAQAGRLLETQRQIVASALAMLADRGHVLYATCSVDPEENHGFVRDAAAAHGLVITAERATEPAGAPGGDPAAHHDGGYAALLQRAAR